MFSRTGLSNLLNKMQFTFEVVPCLILGLFRQFLKVCINFGPVLQVGWVGGRREGQVRVGGGEEGGKKPQVKTQGHQSPLDGPDHSIRPKGHHSGRR